MPRTTVPRPQAAQVGTPYTSFATSPSYPSPNTAYTAVSTGSHHGAVVRIPSLRRHTGRPDAERQGPHRGRGSSPSCHFVSSASKPVGRRAAALRFTIPSLSSKLRRPSGTPMLVDVLDGGAGAGSGADGRY